MLLYILAFLSISILFFIVLRQRKRKCEPFIKDFDDVLDYKCSVITENQQDDYNFTTSKCQSSSCPLETCYKLRRSDTDLPIDVHEFNEETMFQKKTIAKDDSFTCSTNHDPDNNIWCGIDEPICQQELMEKTCFSFNEGNVVGEWKPNTYIKATNSEGKCVWMNKENQSDTKTDIEISNCREKPFTCDDKKVQCSTYNPSKKFNDNFQYYMVDPKDGEKCIIDSNKGCDDSCVGIGNTTYLYEYIPNQRKFKPDLYVKQKINNNCVFLNSAGKCIPEQVQDGRPHQYNPNVHSFCSKVGYSDSSVLYINKNNCHEKPPKFCSNLDSRDELIFDKYIATNNNSDPSLCMYTNVQKSTDILSNNPFKCPRFRNCKSSDQFRNAREGKCTPCPVGQFIDPRNNSHDQFSVSTACTPVASCEAIDRCFIPYRGFNGITTNNILVETEFQQEHDPEIPWDCKKTYEGICRKCPDGKSVLSEKGAVFCDLCDIDGTNEYALNMKTKRCEKVYNCDLEEGQISQCFDHNNYTINHFLYSNQDKDDRFTPCKYHKIFYDDNLVESTTDTGIEKKETSPDCPEPKCPTNSFIDYIKKQISVGDEYTLEEVDKKCKGAYATYTEDGAKENVGCYRCELPRCKVVKEFQIESEAFEESVKGIFPDQTIYEILAYCTEKTQENDTCPYAPYDNDKIDPKNKEPICKVSSATKTLKLISETYNNENYKKCYYSKESSGISDLDANDVKDLTNIQFGIYDSDTPVFIGETTNDADCPQNCEVGKYTFGTNIFTESGKDANTSIGEKPSINQAFDILKNTKTLEHDIERKTDGISYERNEKCSDHIEPYKTGFILDRVEVTPSKGRYGKTCEEAIQNRVEYKTYVLYDDINHKNTSTNSCSLQNCPITKDSVNSYTIKKPSQLPYCNIPEACVQACDGSEKCESLDVDNPCKLSKKCPKIASFEASALGNKPSGSCDIEFEFPCTTNCKRCDGLYDGHEYIISNNESIISEFTTNTTKIFPSTPNNYSFRSDSPMGQYLNSGSYNNKLKSMDKYCYKDSQSPSFEVLRVKLHDKDGDQCFTDDSDNIITRKRMEFKIEQNTNNEQFECDSHICKSQHIFPDETIIIYEDQSSYNETRKLYDDTHIKVKRNFKLKQENMKCGETPGFCYSQQLDGLKTMMNSTDYNTSICRFFREVNKTDTEQGISKFKDGVKADPSNFEYEQVTSRYTHIVLDRTNEEAIVAYYYYLHNTLLEDDNNFEYNENFDTYINLIGGTGIDCENNDIYDYTNQECSCSQNQNTGQVIGVKTGNLREEYLNTGCPVNKEAQCDDECNALCEYIVTGCDETCKIQGDSSPPLNKEVVLSSSENCIKDTKNYPENQDGEILPIPCPPIPDCQECEENEVIVDDSACSTCGYDGTGEKEYISYTPREPGSCSPRINKECSPTPPCVVQCKPSKLLCSTIGSSPDKCAAQITIPKSGKNMNDVDDSACEGYDTVPNTCLQNYTHVNRHCCEFLEANEIRSGFYLGNECSDRVVNRRNGSSVNKDPAVAPGVDDICKVSVQQYIINRSQLANDDPHAIPKPSSCSSCASNHWQYGNDGKRAYKYFNTPEKYSTASNICKSNGGYLFTIENNLDADTIHQLMDRCEKPGEDPLGIWLGARRNDGGYPTALEERDRTNYYWEHETTNKQFSGTDGIRWHLNEPNTDLGTANRIIYNKRTPGGIRGMNDVPDRDDVKMSFFCVKPEWFVYNNYNITGGAFWDGAPQSPQSPDSGGTWVLQSEYTLDQVKELIGNLDLVIVKTEFRYYIRVNDGNNKLVQAPNVTSYVKNNSVIEYK